MSITVELPAELEAALRNRAAKAGKTTEAYVLDLLISRLRKPPQRRSRPLSGAKLKEALDQISQLHASSPAVEIDDSRESIYEDRGLVNGEL